MEIIKIITSLLSSDKFFDLFKGKEKRLQEFQLALIDQLQQNNNAQIELNKVEASHKNLFVAGWRPFIGWVSGVAVAYQFILRDLLSYVITLFNPEYLSPPSLDIDQLISILIAMLGMAGYRTYEKIKKVQ